MKMVLSGLLTDVLSGNSETDAGLSLTEFLQENNNRISEYMINTFSRGIIYFLLICFLTPFPSFPQGGKVPRGRQALSLKLPTGQFLNARPSPRGKVGKGV